jgi:hypothetical protein
LDRLIPIVALKLRLVFRQGRGPWAIVGILLMVLFFVVPFGIGLGAFTYMGLETLPGRDKGEFLHLVLAGVWVFWLVFPVVGFSLNQSYDLTRLFIYPISKRTIFVANLLGCFLDPTLLLVLPMFAVILLSRCGSLPAVPLVFLALALFVAQTVAFSQAVLWGLLNILRSRRIRDWAILLAPLIALVFYLAPHMLANGVVGSGSEVFKRLVAWHPSRYLGYTPVGMAAGAIGAAAQGAYFASAGRLLGAAAYLLVTIALGGFILGRLHVGEIGAQPARKAQQTSTRSEPALQRLATNPLAAIALKEARYYWRDPRHKSMFIAPLFPIAVVLAGALSTGMWRPPSAIAFTAFVCLAGFAGLFQNIFGVDREGLRLLFLTPCHREDILIGKNIAAVGVATLTGSVAVVVVGSVLGDASLAAICAAFIFPFALILSSVGNVISIHFPHRLARRGENPFTTSSGAGCLTALARLGGLMVAWLVGLPIFAGALLPTVLHRPVAYGFTVPLAVLYAAGVYAGVLRFYSAGALARNETKILEECLTGEAT